jgi:serine/threonine protein kinase/Tol biopolymer transport system component
VNQEHWRKVEKLFHSALECAPEGQRRFLDTACCGDTDLRRQLELLLANEEQAGSFLEIPALEEKIDTPAAAGSLLGRQFGPYNILSPLGAGGMGEVYRAHDGKLGRDVAIKTLPGEFARDPERLARFRREARTLASFNHPNIATIYGLEQLGDVDCLVMELVPGETLRERVAREGPLPLEEAQEICHQIAEALEAAHDKGIIHRDLKPANVKVTPQGRVKVLDFGLAKAVWVQEGDQDFSQRSTATGIETLAGHIVGTPGYMSPEQAHGREVDKRTDVWAFGCLLYELLAGKGAYQGETQSDTIAAVLEHEPDWRALSAKTPAKIRDLLRQCLQKDADLRLDNIADARRTIEETQRGWNRWRLVAVAATVLALLATGAALWLRGSFRAADRSEWVQLTKFPDAVSQPSLSPDGRMLAFIRGSSTFVGPGQIYVKFLPDGEAVALTHDKLNKMSPAFSPDGTRIAYSVVDPQFGWNTWTVPVRGGEPQLLLKNASGLVWSGPRQVMFSEMKMGEHMAIVAAGESRIGQRDVYVPVDESGMAHRGYVSPDGKWALLVEMDQDNLWLPCRLVPMDGRSPSHSIGPSSGGCTSGGWSPDGKWMYFTSNAVGANHIWRQRFPDGASEQVTSGPTEEEGIAMAPDGRSFVTAVALQNASLWVHYANGERQVLLEGNAADAAFTPDGKKLLYRIVREAPNAFGFYNFYRDLTEVRVVDVESGRSEALARGVLALNYDVSADGRQVVIETADREGKPRVCLASLDGSTPPRQIPNVEGKRPKFGPDGEILFRRMEHKRGTAGNDGFIYRVRQDGTGMRKAFEQPVDAFWKVSRDGNWIEFWGPRPGDGPSAQQFLPLAGGPPVVISAGWLDWVWTADGKAVAISSNGVGIVAEGRTYIVPLPRGQMFPRIPPGGFRSEEEIARLPGAHKIDLAGTVPGPSPDVYAFYRGTAKRNLYRIPVP